MVTFVQATYALVTFVNISNILAVTCPILAKLFGPNFFGVISFVDQNVLGQNFSRHIILFELKFPLVLKFFWTHNFFQNIFPDQKFILALNIFSKKIFQPQIFFKTKSVLGPKISRPEILLVPKKFWNQNLFGPKFFQTHIFFIPTKNIFGTKFFFNFFSDTRCFWTQTL